MFKTLFFICSILISGRLFARVEMRWLTVASLSLDDGKTRILLDPAWTRPGLQHWLNLEGFRSDEKLVEKVLSENGLTELDAVFVSHSHFDHAVDAPMVAKKTGAIFYADESSERIARAYKDPKIKTVRIEDQRPIKIGDFTFIPIRRQHPKILHLMEFLPGSVPEDFDFGFYDYRVGDTWFYIIHHPEGTIILDQSAESYLDLAAKHTAKADALVQGVANRKDDDEILNGYLGKYRPKVFVPNHFDNFFFTMTPKEESFLPRIMLPEFLENLVKKYPETRAVKPKYGEKIVLLEGPGPQVPAKKTVLKVE